MLGSILAGCIGGYSGSDCVPYQPNIHINGESMSQSSYLTLPYGEPVELAFLHYKEGCARTGEMADWRMIMGPGGGWYNKTAPLDGFVFDPPHLGTYIVTVTARDAEGRMHGETMPQWWGWSWDEEMAIPGQGHEVRYPVACCFHWINATVTGPLPGWTLEAFLDDQLIATGVDELHRRRTFDELGDAFLGTLRIVATPPVPTIVEHRLLIDIQMQAFPQCNWDCRA